MNCQVDHTGIVIVLSFAAFFGVLALLNELIDIWRNKK